MRIRVRGTKGNACARMLIAAVALFLCLMSLLPAARADVDGMLRVKLTRLGAPSAIEMTADCDYSLAGNAAARIPAGTPMRLTASRGSLVLSAGDRTATLGASARLVRGTTGSKGMRFTAPALSNLFCGDLEFTASGSVITVVLHIYIEDYLCGAVGYAMAPSSGLEALKAQAVASRNYALRQKAAHAGAAFDLTDTADALPFKGYSAADEYADAVKAVQATRGCVLYCGDSPAVCYTCESNGGQTESAANAFGTALAYSAVMDDPYDLDGAGAKRTAVIRKDAAELAPELREALIDGAAGQLGADADSLRIAGIERVTAGNPRYAAPSRLYRALTFLVNVTNGAQTASVQVDIPTYGALESWYDLGINAESNETVYVSETDRAFEVTFRRSGHGVGMSQKGAQAMARSGRSCAEILQYYYPGTTLRELALSRSAALAGADDASPIPQPIATARLNEEAGLYQHADQSADMLTVLPAGATVDVYAVQGGWAAVGGGGRYGFVRTDALTTESQAAPDDDITVVDGDVYAQLTGDAGLYVNADDTVPARATLPADSYVQVVAYNQTWALVRTTDGDQGYVKLDHLAAASAPAGEGGIDGGEITVVDGGVTAYAQRDGLPVYRSYDVSSDVLTTVDAGERVLVGAYNAKWACVRANGATGFMRVDGLGETAPDAQNGTAADGEIEGGEITVVDGGVTAFAARDGAALCESWRDDAIRLATLSEGERVLVGAYNAKWACVRVDGVTGYMRVEDLKPAGDAGEAGESAGDISYQECEAVTTTALSLCRDADLDGETVLQLDEGVQVHVLAYNNRVAYVEYRGTRGFAALRYLRRR